mgnify:CR=1 FL=1
MQESGSIVGVRWEYAAGQFGTDWHFLLYMALLSEDGKAGLNGHLIFSGLNMFLFLYCNCSGGVLFMLAECNTTATGYPNK